MCLWEFLRVTIGTCVFCADGIMITNNSNNYYLFLNVFILRIMSMTLKNINPQKEIFHHYDFPVYTTSKYRDSKLDTYRQITQRLVWFHFFPNLTLNIAKRSDLRYFLFFVSLCHVLITPRSKTMTKLRRGAYIFDVIYNTMSSRSRNSEMGNYSRVY